MNTKIENIIKPDYGSIRQIYFNKSVEAFLFETECGFQFIYKEGQIIIDTIGQQFKVMGNTFIHNQVSVISKKGLYKIDIEDLINKTTSSFGIWGDVENSATYIANLNFPFLQYYSGHLKSIEFSDRLILVDGIIGILIYNVLSEEVEFKFNITLKNVSTVFNEHIEKEIYWIAIDKFEVSEDEKYFYVISAYEGKSLFIFRTDDCSLLYHEIGSYALSFGLFVKDKFIIPSGYDYDANDKQPFKIVNLIDGSIEIINKTSEDIEYFDFGAKFQNLFIAYNQLSNSDVYNYERNIIAIKINDIIISKTISKKEISIDPEINLKNISLINIFIQDNYLFALTWNSSVSIHSITQKEENYMDELINSINSELGDYRADEENPDVQMSPDKIRIWINQFNEGLRIPILTELDNIFKKRYCSKKKIKSFLEAIVKKLSEDFKFSTHQEFLRNSYFLNLQPAGKSQRIMLSLFDELIQDKYSLSLNDCGTISKRYSIYIDDILCTGLTLISDIKEWSEQIFTAKKTNGQAVADNSTTLVFAYVFIYEKNYQKKVAEMRHKISSEVSSNHMMYRLIEIENGTALRSKIDLLYPLENGQPQNVTDYKDEIIELVDNHTIKYNKVSPEEFYRPPGQPAEEHFFSSRENRIIVENAFLEKGIEILRNANPTNKNIRALGYSIPALKNFGFGALCFTWRNVPNNAPLVFWYSGGGFTPLFKVTRGENPIVNFNFVAKPINPVDDLPW